MGLSLLGFANRAVWRPPRDLDTDMPQWVRVEPTPGNGLRQTSRVMCDWPQTVWSARIQTVIGALDSASMTQVTALLTASLRPGEVDA